MFRPCLPRASRRLASLRALPVVLFLALAARGSAEPAPQPGLGQRAAPGQSQTEVPGELFEVVTIVDGDTIHILRNGKKEKLRFLSVDTEEKINPGGSSSATKPQTVFGEETKLWTIDFLEQFRGEDGKLRVGLAFPEGKEARDIYDRLLCHVLLPDGTDFNLLLVKLGKSPYFNKYGNSLIAHEAFVAAQRQARRNLLGIWNPRTNEARDAGTPSAKRPYDQLLPWWQARAEAIDVFRERQRREPERILAADDADALATALSTGAAVEIFGTPDRTFEESDGSLTVLFRSEDRSRALRVSIPADSRAAFEVFDVDALTKEFRQNYVFVKGQVVQGERGFLVVTPDPTKWCRAAREPASLQNR